jgi:hypothetical protein
MTLPVIIPSFPQGRTLRINVNLIETVQNCNDRPPKGVSTMFRGISAIYYGCATCVESGFGARGCAFDQPA